MRKWHFTILGEKGSPYENGIYHGILKLKETYPLHPPDISFFNNNGRFYINMNVCLNITSYHTYEWNPIWTIRKMVGAIKAYFILDEKGIGSLVKTKEERG